MGPVVSDVAISEISESPPKNAVEDNQCTNFPPHWWSICESVRDNLPEGYQIGPLHKNDYDHGFLECLSQLTVVGRVSQQLFEETLYHFSSNPNTYMPVVIRGPDQKIVACGTLMLERKFIHNCGILAHIEDIVVRSEERGMGLGKLLISQLSYLARHQGAYKITLDCDPENAPFYAKSSFEVKGLQMCVYFRDTPGSSKQE